MCINIYIYIELLSWVLGPLVLSLRTHAGILISTPLENDMVIVFRKALILRSPAASSLKLYGLAFMSPLGMVSWLGCALEGVLMSRA